MSFTDLKEKLVFGFFIYSACLLGIGILLGRFVPIPVEDNIPIIQTAESYYITDLSQYIVPMDCGIHFAQEDTTSISGESFSMYPTINCFDSIRVKSINSSDSVRLGDIHIRRHKENYLDAGVVHRLVDCVDYPTCEILIYRGDNNAYNDAPITRSEYDLQLVVGIDYGDSSSYFEKVRGTAQ